MPGVNIKKPTAIDKLVGSRVRLVRHELQWTQSELADKIGISFQQVQKYEKGYNRISAGTLYRFAELMGKPITYFYATEENPHDLDAEFSSAFDACQTMIDEFQGTTNILSARDMLALIKS